MGPGDRPQPFFGYQQSSERNSQRGPHGIAATAIASPLGVQWGREAPPSKGYHRRRTLAVEPEALEGGHGLFSTIEPRIEGQWLLRLAGKRGETVESVRELIQVPAKIEKLLRGYAQTRPEGIKRQFGG